MNKQFIRNVKFSEIKVRGIQPLEISYLQPPIQPLSTPPIYNLRGCIYTGYTSLYIQVYTPKIDMGRTAKGLFPPLPPIWARLVYTPVYPWKDKRGTAGGLLSPLPPEAE